MFSNILNKRNVALEMYSHKVDKKEDTISYVYGTVHHLYS